MYQRIKNRLDVELIKESLESEQVGMGVIKRAEELAGVLDREYGCCRGSSDMGGYILLFTGKQSCEKCIQKVMDFYHLERNSAEYSEVIGCMGDDRTEWHEELYLLSSDDALVLIYPEIQA